MEPHSSVTHGVTLVPSQDRGHTSYSYHHPCGLENVGIKSDLT